MSNDYVWSEPELLGPIVNAAMSTRSPTLSDDQLCLIVSQHHGAGDKKNGLVEFRRATPAGAWSDGSKCFESDRHHIVDRQIDLQVSTATDLKLARFFAGKT